LLSFHIFDVERDILDRLLGVFIEPSGKISYLLYVVSTYVVHNTAFGILADFWTSRELYISGLPNTSVTRRARFLFLFDSSLFDFTHPASKGIS
jgi:hypothetical protein